METPRDVLFISPFLWSFGDKAGLASVYNTIQGYVKAGYRAHLLIATNDPQELQRETFVYEGIYIHYFRILVNPYSEVYNLYHSIFMIKPKAKLIQGVIRRLMWLCFVLWGTLAAYKIAKKIEFGFVYGFTYFGQPVAYAIGHRFNIPNFSRQLGMVELAPEKTRTLAQKILRTPQIIGVSLPCVALIINDDGTLINEGLRALGISSDHVRVWRNGIDKSIFDHIIMSRAEIRQQLGLPVDKRIVLSTSRLTRAKRVHLLIEAIPKIIAEYENVLFVILGDGPGRPKLESLCEHLGIQAHVRFEGMVAQEKVLRYCFSADLFTSLAAYSNASNVTFEAMLAGNAVAVMDTERTAELIRHRENGILIPENAPERISEALLQLLRDDVLCKNLGMSARQYIQTEFQTWDERLAMEVREVERLCEQWRAS